MCTALHGFLTSTAISFYVTITIRKNKLPSSSSSEEKDCTALHGLLTLTAIRFL